MNFYLCTFNFSSVRTYLLVFFTIFCFVVHAFAVKVNGQKETSRKSTVAHRIHCDIKIDAYETDSVWNQIPYIDDFKQYQPNYEAEPSFRTEVKIAYNNHSIYVLAVMHDPNPDSIFRQLGLRDSENLNADMFSIEFDTYNNQLDAYSFRVTSSGTQLDSRESDETYNAVWESKTRICHDGWIAEMRIPYSAIRFARIPSQIWGLEISRSIRRYRETNQWSLESLEASNDLPYWGLLTGIQDINPPIRLSVSPYAVLHAEHFPDENASSNLSTSMSGGMDLKYGIDQSFTLDMSLLPDFSQVQSDNKVKNLSAFETVYEEQRPFFNEAVDLFMKGDIFYSRRIGKTPELFYSVVDSLAEGEKLHKNPTRQHLINSTKVSGRTKKGLAIGVLNAVSANTYATITNDNNVERNILTDPASNYNILVFDQALKNNSNAYIINSNMLRSHGFSDANVVAAGANLLDRSTTYQLTIKGGMSMINHAIRKFDASDENAKGYKYGIGFYKVKGKFQWTLQRNMIDKNFNANDLGLTLYNNYNDNIASLTYSIYKPFWKLRYFSNRLQITNQNNNTTGKNQKSNIQYSLESTTLKYISFWGNISYRFIEGNDYYEPRGENRYFRIPKFITGYCGFSTDYRKAFAFDGGYSRYAAPNSPIHGFSVNISPRFQFGKRFTLFFESEKIINKHDEGYVSNTENQIVFGARNINTLISSLSGNYLFTNNLSAILSARHYWSTGKYTDFYALGENGRLTNLEGYTANHDFNFNSFALDMMLTWVFAPGSSMNLVWKNEINDEKDQVYGTYFRNAFDILSGPQLNSLSFKILYYIDYQNILRNNT